MELTTFIVDDEQQTRDALQELLLEFCPGVVIKGTAGSISEALAVLPSKEIDILFLDINLDGTQTGFDLLDQLGPYDFDVVFVTAYEEYAVKAFAYAAVHYLLKPVSHRMLIDTIYRIRKKKTAAAGVKQLTDTLQQTLQATAPRIALSDMNKTEFVPIDDIVYLESSGSYTNFYLEDKRLFVKSKNLKYFEDALMKHVQFVRVHKSYIVNGHHIRAYRKGSQELEFFNGTVVPVSIGYKALLDQLGNRFIS